MPNSSWQHVRLTSDFGVGHVLLARPDRRNVLGFGASGSRAELVAALREADADPGVRCVLISAEGPTFCAGGDLSAPPAADATRTADEALIAEVDAFHSAVRAISKPVVAAVHGACLGSGLALLAQCDFVLAADNARFGLPEGRFGHPGGSELVGVIGPAWAKFLIFTGETLTASEAKECGLVLFVIPAASLVERATDLARRIASLPPQSVRLNKQAIGAASEASGRMAGRLAGRAVDLHTVARSHEATAPDGRTFDAVRAVDGVAGLREASRDRFADSWLDSVRTVR